MLSIEPTRAPDQASAAPIQVWPLPWIFSGGLAPPSRAMLLEQREPGWGKVAFWSPCLTGQDRGWEQRFLKPPRQQRLLTSRSCAARSVLGSWQVGGVVRAEVTPSRVSHSSFPLLQQPGSQLFPMRWLQNVGSLDP